MNEDREKIDVKRLIADAMEDARDAPLDPQRLKSIRNLLSTNAEARKYYLELNHFIYSMTSENNLSMSFHTAHVDNSPPLPRPRFLLKSLVSAPAIAAYLVLIILTVLIYENEQTVEASPIIASLEQINGNISITSADTEARTIKSNVKIKSGDTVRTESDLSSAVLVYPDGTRIFLVGNTSLTAFNDGQKRIDFQGETMFASVVPQAVGHPMLLVTPQANLRVLGTKFSLDATPIETDLSVSEGTVEFTRLRDGKSVEVPAGQHVVSNQRSELALEENRAAPDHWRVDFENGLPDGWQSGNFVSEELPQGSRGAVQAAFQSNQSNESYSIVAKAEWLRGAFTVHPDSQIQITFKMETPNWVNILLLARTKDSDTPRFANNFQYNEIPFRQLEPGRWYSISIPLSKFQRLPGYTEHTLKDLLPFNLVFSSMGPDRELVIDEIKITRGSSGIVELNSID